MEAAFCSETQERAFRQGWRILKRDCPDIHDLVFVRAVKALLFKFPGDALLSITSTYFSLHWDLEL